MSRKLLTNIRSNTIGFLYYLMAVLVAISIPVFTSQLEKSRESTDAANIRSAYAEVVTKYLADTSSITITVSQQQKVAGWQTSPTPVLTYQGGDGTQATYTLPSPNATGNFSVGINVASSDGTATPSITAN